MNQIPPKQQQCQSVGNSLPNCIDGHVSSLSEDSATDIPANKFNTSESESPNPENVFLRGSPSSDTQADNVAKFKEEPSASKRNKSASRLLFGRFSRMFDYNVSNRFSNNTVQPISDQELDKTDDYYEEEKDVVTSPHLQERCLSSGEIVAKDSIGYLPVSKRQKFASGFRNITSRSAPITTTKNNNVIIRDGCNGLVDVKPMNQVCSISVL